MSTDKIIQLSLHKLFQEIDNGSSSHSLSLNLAVKRVLNCGSISG